MVISYRNSPIAPLGLADTCYSVWNQYIIPARWALQKKTEHIKVLIYLIHKCIKVGFVPLFLLPLLF